MDEQKEKVKKKHGRPSLYTKELGDEICHTMVQTGKSMRSLCEENKHWPDRNTIFEWTRQFPSFASQYAQARRDQIETYIDEIVQISDDMSQDVIINEEGEQVINKEFIARARLKVDTRKWLACKLIPRVYGERVLTTQDNDADNPLLREALERQKKLDKDNEKEF